MDATFYATGFVKGTSARQHDNAMDHPRGFEAPISGMIKAWRLYAIEHAVCYESPIGEDYVLGPAWLEMGRTIHRLLDGETGRLDCGTLSHYLITFAKENGMDWEECE